MDVRGVTEQDCSRASQSSESVPRKKLCSIANLPGAFAKVMSITNEPVGMRATNANKKVFEAVHRTAQLLFKKLVSGKKPAGMSRAFSAYIGTAERFGEKDEGI